MTRRTGAGERRRIQTAGSLRIETIEGSRPRLRRTRQVWVLNHPGSLGRGFSGNGESANVSLPTRGRRRKVQFKRRTVYSSDLLKRRTTRQAPDRASSGPRSEGLLRTWRASPLSTSPGVVDLLADISPICVYPCFICGRHFSHSPLGPTTKESLLIPCRR